MRFKISSNSMQVILVAVLLAVLGEVSYGNSQELSLHEVHHFEVEDFDHPGLDEVRFPPDEEIFVALEARLTTEDETRRPIIITAVADTQDDSGSSVYLTEPQNIAFDAKTRRLFLFEATTSDLVELWLDRDDSSAAVEVARLSASELGLVEPRGLAVGAGGQSLFVFDRGREVIVELDLSGDPKNPGPIHLGDHRVATVVLEAQGLPALGGLAYDPSSRHFLILSSSLESLYEFSATGPLVRSHDVSGLELIEPVRILFAPSADLTDDPSVMHLYLADGGPEGEALQSRIREFSLGTSAQSPMSAVPIEMAAPVMETASLVQVIDTSAFTPPSPDTAGIAYFSSMDTLLASDSEVNEMPIFTGDNVFEVSLFGALLATGSTITYSNEPTGVGFDPGVNESGGDGTVFFSDDTGTEGVYVVDLGLDGLYGTGDDVVTSFSAEAFGAGDAEGITFDTAQGVLFLVDGVNSEVYRIDPGPNGQFDGVPSDGGDDQVTSFDTASLGVTDPEGIAYDTNQGSLYVVGDPETLIIETSTAGVLLTDIDISAANAVKPAGLAFAPSSQNPAAWNLYLAERGVDNNSNPQRRRGL
jgi:hypothetical protein